MITVEQIQQWLDEGRCVYSCAIGRVGPVVGTSDDWVKIKLRRKISGSEIGVTKFTSGDEVSAFEMTDGSIEIKNTFDAEAA